MRPAFITLTIFLAVLVAAPQGHAQSTASATTVAPAGIEWLRYDVGLEKAKREGKPILVDFTATWCGWCKKMERETFSDTLVARYISTAYVPVKVWQDDTTHAGAVLYKGERLRQSVLVRRLGVSGYPTFWFLSAEGTALAQLKGYRPKTEFVPALEYIGGGHYKTMSYEKFLQKKTG